jgi:hypothetical protein
VKLRALLVVGLLAGLFAPRWLREPLHASCCCPEGMEGACSRTDEDCSLKRCMPDGAAAIAVSAPKMLLPAAQTLPALAGGNLLALLDAQRVTAPPDDPSDPPPRA